MRYSTIIIAFLAFITTASDVEPLTRNTFRPFIQERGVVLAEFYAPWCPSCKSLAPIFEAAATILKEKSISLANIDCMEEKTLCEEYGVRGYPTLKIFRGLENVSPYVGDERTPDGMIAYMTNQALPAVSTVTKETIEDFKTADEIVLIAYFATDDRLSDDVFTQVASNLRHRFSFGATSDTSLARAEGIYFPSIVLYRSFDEGKIVFTEKFDVKAICDFANRGAVPLIGEFDLQKYEDYMASGLPLAYIFVAGPDERDMLAKELRPLAQRNKDAISFVTIDAKRFSEHAYSLNLKVDNWPAFAVHRIDNNEKFPYDQAKEMTADSIGVFIQDFLAGKLHPSIKSEPIPEAQDSPVRIVVAKTYKDVILEDEKDVLVQFYAPWCRHCKALASKYEELGELYASDEFTKLVTIAKIDATVNDVPDDIQGFPTIKLFPAGKKNTPIEYSGPRTITDFVQFIRSNGSHKVDAVYVEAKRSAEFVFSDVERHDEL